MSVAFSVASWNVEHFGRSAGGQPDQARVKRVCDARAKHKPDVFAIYEVEGASLFNEIRDRFPSHSFVITEGPQTQEILVGVSKNLECSLHSARSFRVAPW